MVNLTFIEQPFTKTITELVTGDNYRKLQEARQKLTLRTTLLLPELVKVIKPQEIQAIRVGLNLSQSLFARALNVPVTTARSWESGRRKPTGAALRLLEVVRRYPRAVFPSLV